MRVIEINDKEYEVKYTINTLVRMEQDGIEVMKLESIFNNISFGFIRKLFFYGLKESIGKSLTENKAGEMMDEYLEHNNYHDLMAMLVQELAKSLGYDLDEKEDKESGEDAGK